MILHPGQLAKTEKYILYMIPSVAIENKGLKDSVQSIKPQFGVRSAQFFWLAISFTASARMGSMLYAASAATK